MLAGCHLLSSVALATATQHKVYVPKKSYLHELVGAEGSAGLNSFLNFVRPFYAYPEIAFNGYIHGLTGINYKSPLWFWWDGISSIVATVNILDNYFSNGMSQESGQNL